MNEQTLNLRDIHLPEPISWWPPASGWWILLCCLLIIFIVLVIVRKMYQSRQLRRDIHAELEHIRQQFQETQDKTQLARSLSVLLRRANISYYPQSNIAGLTGEQWLSHLDKTNTNSDSRASFTGEAGRILLSAPYLPDDTRIDFDAQTLLNLCEQWLLAAHSKTQVPLQ